MLKAQDFKRCYSYGRRNGVYETDNRPGDWTCQECGYNNFAYRSQCKNCGEKPKNRRVAEGDWICPKCEFYNFQSRTVCFKCETPNMDMKKSDDWICPNCKFNNFQSRTVCFKCDTPSPDR